MKVMRNLVTSGTFRPADARLVTALAAFIFLVALGGPVRADLAPPDACTAPGQPCANAGPAHDQAGTCMVSTCTRTVPSPDGGTMSMSYQCNLCKVADGGSGGAGGTGGTTGTGGAAGNKPPASKDSGCAVGGGVPAGSAGAVLVLAGVLGLLRDRRRRRP